MQLTVFRLGNTQLRCQSLESKYVEPLSRLRVLGWGVQLAVQFPAQVLGEPTGLGSGECRTGHYGVGREKEARGQGSRHQAFHCMAKWSPLQRNLID